MSDRARTTLHVEVDRTVCELHGQCANIEPEVFELDDQGELRYDTAPPADLEDSVVEAAELCPVQAIRVTRR